MLKNSFQHIPGIGGGTENKLWECGLLDWDCLAADNSYNISPKKYEVLSAHTKDSIEQLERNNPQFFSERLPSKEHWRMFPDFRSSTAYIDIETTGLDPLGADITTIALYDGKTIRYYIQGQNLDDFITDIANYNTLVTFNGKTFDVPFIEGYFSTHLPHTHIDLRYVLKSLGFSGGLKMVEKNMGLNRGDLEGVDGYFAVLLWMDYQKNNNEKALETLLAYNIEDVVNLEILMIKAYNLKIKNTPFFKTHEISFPSEPEIPFKPDRKTIDRIKNESFRSPETSWY